MGIQNVLNTLEPQLNQPLKTLLPEEPNLELLEFILERSLAQEKSTRDYSLYSFSSAYSLALPFMRAGQKTIRPGEALFLKTLARDERLNTESTKKLILESQSQTRTHFTHLIELDLFARTFLKTSGLDRFEDLFLNALDLLKEKQLLSTEDEELLKKAFLTAEQRLLKRKTKILNSLPSFSSNQQKPVEGLFLTHRPELVDNREVSFELFTPLMRDFLDGLKAGNFKEDSLGLGAFLPFLRALNQDEILGLILEVERGQLKAFQLIKKPEGEDMPPVFGPFRAQLSAMLFMAEPQKKMPLEKSASREDLLVSIENLSLEEQIKQKKEKNKFLVALVLGAVSVPKDLEIFYEENQARLIEEKENQIHAASEAYVLSPSIKKAINLDPVSVPYQTGEEDFWHFAMTRFLYFLDHARRPFPHQGVAAILSNEKAYHPACLDKNGRLAEKILKKDFALLTGEFGQDQVVKTFEQVFSFINNKYPRTKKRKSKKELLKAITGQFGQTFGLSEEVYSLFYQDSFERNQILSLAALEAPRFLSAVRTFPQRFSLKDYLP